ncbi:MAG: hypothetical protein QW273_04015, partial [Candidatus Pacearchaeota archaeon]
MVSQESYRKKKSLKLSIIEGSFYSVSEGMGLRNISPYALAMGASNSFIALLSSLPSLAGSFFQLFSYKISKRRTKKEIISKAVFLQSFFWILMIIPGLLFLKYESLTNFYFFLLLIIYTVLIILGAIISPIWNAWMKDLIDERELGSYFSRRNRICSIISFISLLIGGFVLDKFKEINYAIYGFF